MIVSATETAMTSGPTRRDFLKSGACATLALGSFPVPRIRYTAAFDLVILDAIILDGTGGPAWRGDLGIVGDTITAVGSISPEQGSHVIETSGLHVAPGFIDIHTHSDDSIVAYPSADSRVRQGVTTEVTGNCGYSAAPMEGAEAERRRGDAEEEYGLQVEWTGVASYFKALEELEISTNHALLLGQGTLRENVVGLENRRLTDDEMKSVLRAVEEGLDHGAVGLSTGLEYAPGRFTPTEEIVQLARVVARRNGLYASHIRNEEANLLAAVDEAIQIGRETGVRVEISHLKAAGRPNWPKQQAALDLIESARRDGVQVLADAYPYTAYSTGLTIFMPTWALEGGWSRLAQRLDDVTDRARIRDAYNSQISVDPGSYDLIVIASTRSEKNQPLVGMNLVQIAERWDLEPVDAALRLLEEEEGRVGLVGHGMSPENVELVLSHPLVMIGSDGSSMAPTGRAAETRPHPRSYGTYPRVLAHYVRERKIFDLPTAIKKMTSMPADQVGIKDRGRIARGMRADLVVFDAAEVQDQATFDDPHRYPVGIHYVLVNGRLLVNDGEPTGARPGRVLSKS
jgi:N-acyl-D-amino-acid deacylase